MLLPHTHLAEIARCALHCREGRNDKGYMENHSHPYISRAPQSAIFIAQKVRARLGDSPTRERDLLRAGLVFGEGIIS